MNIKHEASMAQTMKDMRQQVERIHYAASGGSPINTVAACRQLIDKLRKLENDYTVAWREKVTASPPPPAPPVEAPPPKRKPGRPRKLPPTETEKSAS